MDSRKRKSSADIPEVITLDDSTDEDVDVDVVPEEQDNEAVHLVTIQLNLDVNSVRKYYEIFKNIQSLIAKLASNERRLTTRDFFTACKRLCEKDLSPTNAFLALYESWALHLSREEQRIEAATLIANAFSLSTSDINIICNVRVVEVLKTSRDITIGRVWRKTKQMMP